jgi:hypothetical protein
MEMEKILDFLKNADMGAWVCRPATDEDIAECKKNLDELGLEPLPPHYEAFLKICNGFAWNGMEFWSTDQVSGDGDASYRLMDLVTMNDDLDDRYSENLESEVFYLGRADDDIYTYNTDTQKYEIRSMEEACSESYGEYDTFAELFSYTVGGRLGFNGGSNNA